MIARPNVLLAMATTVLGAGAMFTLYTYVAPVLADLTGASDRFVTLGLVLIGVGFTLGNSLGGRLADWSLDGSARLFLGVLALIMVLMPFVLGSHVGAALALLVWGIFTFAVVPPLQMRVMIAASEAPGLASSINVGAFNLGNAVGQRWVARSSAWTWATPRYRSPAACWRQAACCWSGWADAARSPPGPWAGPCSSPPEEASQGRAVRVKLWAVPWRSHARSTSVALLRRCRRMRERWTRGRAATHFTIPLAGRSPSSKTTWALPCSSGAISACT